MRDGLPAHGRPRLCLKPLDRGNDPDARSDRCARRGAVAGRVDRARAFFADKLGLQPVAEYNGHLHYEVDGSYFVVFPSRGRPSGDHDQLGFVVDDVGRTAAALRAKGVAVRNDEAPSEATSRDGIVDFGDVKAAWFEDSEGNLLSVAEFAGGSPFRRADG